MNRGVVTSAASREPIIVLVDDTRVFRDGRATHVARTSDQALAVLGALEGQPVHELWLDHDLFEHTSQPVVDHLVARAAAGAPLPVDAILVHSSRIAEGHAIVARLRTAGYRVRPNYSAGIWVRNPNPSPTERNPA